MPGLFRNPAKLSTSLCGVSAVLALGLIIQFARGVWLDVYVSGHRVNFTTLPLYWLLWNLVPLTIFGIAKALQKKGR